MELWNPEEIKKEIDAEIEEVGVVSVRLFSGLNISIVSKLEEDCYIGAYLPCIPTDPRRKIQISDIRKVNH